MWLQLLGYAQARTWYVPSEGSFTDVVAQAAAGDIVQFDPGVYTDAPIQFLVPLTLVGDPQGGTILEAPDRGVGPSMVISADLTLQDLTVDGLGLTQLFQTTVPVVLTLDRVTLQNAADPAVYGGALLMVGGTLFATDVSFLGNSAFEGGALYLSGVALHCTRCTFTDNHIIANGADGGAIWSYGTVTLLDSTFTDNSSADWHGGALSVNLTATISGGAFVNNQAGYDGGAITVRSAASLIIAPSQAGGTRFEGNAAANGGAIGCTDGCSLSIDGAHFSSNTASLDGGHVNVNISTSVSVRDSTFELGSAGANGGAVAVELGPVSLIRAMLCSNQASGLGGGLWAGQSAELDNVAALWNTGLVSGGAIWAGSGRASFTTALGNNAPDGSAVAGLGPLLVDRAALVDQLGGVAVGGVGPVTVQESATWNNPADYAPYVVTVASSTPLSRSPFPGALPGVCALPIPEWSGELVRPDPAGPYELADPDGTLADVGATGGPLASPPLWVDTDIDTVVAMWDCDDSDPMLFPPDCALPETGDTGALLDTGLHPGPGDTGDPETGLSDDPTALPGLDPVPPRASPLGEVVGCGCQQRAGTVSWTIGAILLLALRSRSPCGERSHTSSSSSGRPITRKA